MTESGSYVGGAGDATYQTVVGGSYAFADTYTLNDYQMTLYDDNGQPYDLVLNVSTTYTASGGGSKTFDYHDDGTGLALTSVGSLTGSGSAGDTTRVWGTENGTGFDTTTSGSENWVVTADTDPIPPPYTKDWTPVDLPGVGRFWYWITNYNSNASTGFTVFISLDGGVTSFQLWDYRESTGFVLPKYPWGNSPPITMPDLPAGAGNPNPTPGLMKPGKIIIGDLRDPPLPIPLPKEPPKK